ncbi:hypothetical protein BHM03_00025074 [Ensete ventricosum]|nr:hypothetical protein BHM03_00025074 [Ensete ventricosum]
MASRVSSSEWGRRAGVHQGRYARDLLLARSPLPRLFRLSRCLLPCVFLLLRRAKPLLQANLWQSHDWLCFPPPSHAATASLAFSSEREKEEEDPLHQMAAGSHMFAFLSIDTG